MTVTLPDKPRFNAPCNGCGVCCSLSLCVIGMIAFPEAEAPCPALKIAPCGTRTICSLVKKEQMTGIPPIIQAGLGIGMGCSMSDDDTTQEQIDEQTARFTKQADAMLPPGYFKGQIELHS